MAATSAGNKAIFAGGGAAGGNSSTVDIYDASAGTWSTANLSQARNSLAGASLAGKAYFGGGALAVVGTPISVVDIYDATANTWSTANLSQGRWDPAASAAGDKVVFAGGLTAHYYVSGAASNAVDIYSSSTGTWSTAVLSQPRASLAAGSVGTRIVFAGGWSGSPSNAVDIYDTSTNTWSTATFSQARSSLAAASVGNQVLFGGGASVTGGGPSSVVDIYTLQNYGTITSAKAFTLVDQTTVTGRMQLSAPGSLDLAAFNLSVGSMSGDAPINLGSGTLTAGGDGTSGVYGGSIGGGGGGIIKIGVGTLTLSGLNTYTGDTKIEGGVLSIGNPYLNDLAGVHVSVGAKLNLGFSGSDTVGSLYIDGAPVTAGTWGATGSGAAHIDDVHFSGAGQLNVVPEPSSFVLLGIGAIGLLGYAGRRQSNKRLKAGRWLTPVLLVLAVEAVASATEPVLVRVDFQTNIEPNGWLSVPVANGTVEPVAGAADPVFGSSGSNIWDVRTIAGHNAQPAGVWTTNPTYSNLLDTATGTATSIGISFSGSVSGAGAYPVAGDDLRPDYLVLLNKPGFTNYPSAGYTISGLAANTPATFFLYCGYTIWPENRGFKFTMNGDPATYNVTGMGLKVSGMTDNIGQITGTWGVLDGEPEADFAGFQLYAQPVPEPSTLALLMAGGIALAYAWRRRNRTA
jgi:autotransporter-associated beta strand protein